MKCINEYKKLFGIENEIELKALKKSYRNLVKEWHPDKFQEGHTLQAEAERNNRKIIDGYHFLVSIAPETTAANLPEFTTTIETGITDYQHKGFVLEITYAEGSTYEYFGVNKQVFIKMMQSNKLNRFAKRSIYPNYLYRKSRNSQEASS